jgi:hypothetical protein
MPEQFLSRDNQIAALGPLGLQYPRGGEPIPLPPPHQHPGHPGDDACSDGCGPGGSSCQPAPPEHHEEKATERGARRGRPEGISQPQPFADRIQAPFDVTRRFDWFMPRHA